MITQGYEYTRSGNPTRSVLESTLAALDKAKYGKLKLKWLIEISVQVMDQKMMDI